MHTINKIILSISFGFGLLFCNVGLANCPRPHTILYHCASNGICGWAPKQGWYEGSSDYGPQLHEGDSLPANSFSKALWFPYLDETHGATLCYYYGPVGELITLFQQTGYGAVLKPTGKRWQPITTGDFIGGVECYINPESCGFDFGEKG